MTVAATVREALPEEHPALAALTVAAYQHVLGDAIGGKPHRQSTRPGHM
jgi:hypothetical protein